MRRVLIMALAGAALPPQHRHLPRFMGSATQVPGLASTMEAIRQQLLTRQSWVLVEPRRRDRDAADRHPHSEQPRAAVVVYPHGSIRRALYRLDIQQHDALDVGTAGYLSWPIRRLPDKSDRRLHSAECWPDRLVGLSGEPEAARCPAPRPMLSTMLLGGGGGSLPFGSYIVGFLSPCSATANLSTCDATANSAAIREIGRPPVPEPATWALMLVGFGGIGMAMRRGRKANRKLAQLA